MQTSNLVKCSLNQTECQLTWCIVWVSQSVRSFHSVARQASACVCRDIITGPVHQVHPSCVTYCIMMRLEEHLSCVVNVFIKLLAAKINELRGPKWLKSRPILKVAMSHPYWQISFRFYYLGAFNVGHYTLVSLILSVVPRWRKGSAFVC